MRLHVGFLLLSLGLTCCSKKPLPPMAAAPAAPPPVQAPVKAPPEADSLQKIQDLVAGAFQPVYFPYDQATLSPKARDMLAEAAGLMRREPSVKVVIQGNTDERGTAEYNLALGQRRAQVVKKYLLDFGIESARLQVISYGEERPVQSGADEEAMALNRRDEFLVSF